MSEIESFVRDIQRMLKEAHEKLAAIDHCQDDVWNHRREIDVRFDLFDPQRLAFNEAEDEFDFIEQAAIGIYRRMRHWAKRAGEDLIVGDDVDGWIDTLDGDLLTLKHATRRAQKARESVATASEALKQGSFAFDHIA